MSVNIRLWTGRETQLLRQGREDIVIKVPGRNNNIKEAESGKVIADMSGDNGLCWLPADGAGKPTLAPGAPGAQICPAGPATAGS